MRNKILKFLRKVAPKNNWQKHIFLLIAFLIFDFVLNFIIYIVSIFGATSVLTITTWFLPMMSYFLTFLLVEAMFSSKKIVYASIRIKITAVLWGFISYYLFLFIFTVLFYRFVEFDIRKLMYIYSYSFETISVFFGTRMPSENNISLSVGGGLIFLFALSVALLFKKEQKL